MIIFDHRQKGLSHSKGNAYIIKLIAEKYSNEIIHLFLEQTHYNEILNIYMKNNISLSNVVHHPLPIKLNIGYRMYHYFVQDFKIIKIIYDFMRTTKEEKVFSLYTSTCQLYLMQILSKLNSNVKFYTLIHSELELVDLSRYKSSLKLFLYYLFVSIYIPLNIKLNDNFKYFVLGESIKQNMLNLLPKLKNSVLYFDNNYIFQDKFNFIPFQNNKIKFGIFGMVHPNTNGKVFLRLFEQLAKIENKNFEFHFIGHMRDQELVDKFKKYDFVKIYAKAKEFISDEMLTELGKTVDYGVYGHMADSYKMTASGAFWDTFSFFKPAIVIRNDYFGYYFDKHGNIGYCCNNFDELYKKIISIIRNPNTEEYKKQVLCIEKMRKDINLNSRENLVL